MTRLLIATCAALALLLSGCGGDDEPRAEPSPSASTSSAAPTPQQTRPTVGQCYDLDYRAATGATSDAAPVPCSRPHTAVTIFVGTVDAVDDGHLLAMDSKTVQDQLAATCPTKVGGWVGGDRDRQKLARFSAVWFGPTLRDAEAGATWFRCDLVAVRADDTLAPLRGEAKGALQPDDALDRWGTCGTAAPSEKGFRRVICSDRHSWRAVSVVPLPEGAQYLGKNAQTAADDACKLEAQQRASDPLVYRWSFEWPARDDWNRGDRSGLCWVPTT